MPRPDRPLAVDHVVFWHDSRVRVDAQGTLVIQGVAPGDTGNYSCQAANEVGTDEETVSLYYTGTRPPALPFTNTYSASAYALGSGTQP